MRLWLAPAAALLVSGCIQPILPAGDAQRIDLDACYVWKTPPAYRPFEKFFALPDGSPAFKSLHGARSLEEARGCDVAFTIERDMGLNSCHWSAAIYSMPERKLLTRVAGDEASAVGNPSGLAWAVEAALEPTGDAYRKLKGLPPLPAAPAPAGDSPFAAAPAPAVSSYVAPRPAPERPRPHVAPLTLEQAEAELLP